MTSDEQKIIDIKVRYEDAIYGVMRFTEKIEDLKASQKELKQQLKDGDISLEEYKKQTVATDAVITQYKENIRVLRKELQNNIRQEQEQEGSLKQLRAELSNATKAYDELSRAEREGAKGNELQTHIKEITEELKDAEEATDRFYRNVGNYENAIMNVVGGNSQFGQSLLSIAGNANSLSGVLNNVKTSVVAFGNTLMGLMSNPVFLAIGGLAGAATAAKWFYDYNVGIQRATQLTQQYTGLTGNQLKAVRNEIQATADTFDLDFNETLQAANSMSKGFGISMEDSLKLIQDGIVSGANANGEFLDTIQEYPRYFKEAGLSAEDFVAISTNATKQGVFSDKGVDAIKEANARIREMTTATASALDNIGISSEEVQKGLQDKSLTTFDVMQKVSNKLSELPASSSKVGTAIADIFGGPGEDAGLEYIKTLGTVQLNMSKVKEGAGDVAKAQEQQLNAQRELNNAVSALFDQTGGGFEMMKAQITTIASNVLTGLINGIRGVINYFIDLYNKATIFRAAVQAIGVQFKVVWEVVKVVFGAIVNTIKAAAKVAAGFVKVLSGAVTFDWDTVKEGFADMGRSIVDYFKGNIQNVKNAGVNVGNAFADGVEKTIEGRVKKMEIPTLGAGSKTTTKTKDDKTKDNKTKDDKTKDNNNNNNNTNSKAGSGTSKGGTSSRVKESEVEAKRLEALEKQLQVSIAKVQAEYAQKTMDVKKMYLAGMYEDDKQYQADLDNLQKEELSAMLNTYVQAGVIGEEKAQETQAKLLDLMIQFKEQAKQQAEETVQDYSDEFDRMEEVRRSAQINAGIMPEDDEVGKLERYKQFLADKVAANQENGEVLAALQKEQGETELNLQKAQDNKRLSEMEKSQQRAESIASAITSGFSSAFADMFADSEASFKEFMKSILITTINAIEQALLAYEAQILAKEIASKSWAGVASAAALTALITAAFELAKAGVKSFAVGGLVTGAGTGTSDSIPARLSNGESVMTAKATSMFSPLLSTFNQLGGGVPIVANSSGASIGEDFLAAAVAKGFMMCPAPVVSVTEITRTQKRIQTRQNISRL